MRGIAPIVAVLLLIAVAVAAVAFLWLWFAPQASQPIRDFRGCLLLVDSVSEATSTTGLKSGGSVTVGYGLYAWIRSSGCYARVERAYLLRGDDSLVAVLIPLHGVAKIKSGSVSRVLFVPLSAPVVPPGSYKLVIPLEEADADDAVASVLLRWPLAATVVLPNKSLEELNGTLVRGYGFIVRVVVEPYSPTPEPDDYNITVYLCAEKGWRVYYARITVLNASLQPPIHVDGYYVAEEIPDNLPYSYPDCTIQWYGPIVASEQPLTIIAQAYTLRG